MPDYITMDDGFLSCWSFWITGLAWEWIWFLMQSWRDLSKDAMGVFFLSSLEVLTVFSVIGIKLRVYSLGPR